MVKCCLHFYDCNAATREVQIHHHFECALFVCLNADSSHSFVSHYTDDWYMCALHAIEVGKWSYAQLRRQMGRRRRNSVPSAIWWIQTMYEAATMVTMPQHCLVYTFFSLSMGRFPCVSTVDADTMLTRRANGWCTASKSKLVFVRYVNEFVGELDACGDPSIPTTNRFLQNFNYFPLLWSPPPRPSLHFAFSISSYHASNDNATFEHQRIPIKLHIHIRPLPTTPNRASRVCMGCTHFLWLIYALNSLREPLFLLLMSVACIIIDFILHFARDSREPSTIYLLCESRMVLRKSRAIKREVPSAIVARFCLLFE